MSAKALSVSGLCKRFGNTVALRGVSFELPVGGSLALVGPDGAGKTTTIRLIAGLLTPDTGEIAVFGSPPRSPPAKARIGYLSQRFSLYGDLSVDENISFFAEIHGLESFDGRRDRLLEMTRLAAFRTRAAGKLSGGMKQKLALACALVHEPELLLLDEPTTGVDPISRREFWAILAELLAGGMSLVVATPYLDEAERCAEVGLMDAGSFLAFGSPAELKASLPFVVLELPCTEVRRAAALLRGLPELAGVQTFGDRLAILAPDERAARAAMAARLEPAAIAIDGLRVAPPTLENVFMQVVGPSTGAPGREENVES
ncbi:MAG: ABC transporter ATP-binding protein [Rectinemataceae bacterium]